MTTLPGFAPAHLPAHLLPITSKTSAATSGPETILFSAGCALTKTACAHAALGAKVAILQMVMTPTTIQDVNRKCRLWLLLLPEISSCGSAAFLRDRSAYGQFPHLVAAEHRASPHQRAWGG